MAADLVKQNQTRAACFCLNERLVEVRGAGRFEYVHINTRTIRCELLEHVVCGSRITDGRQRGVCWSEAKSEKLSAGIRKTLAGKTGNAFQRRTEELMKYVAY